MDKEKMVTVIEVLTDRIECMGEVLNERDAMLWDAQRVIDMMNEEIEKRIEKHQETERKLEGFKNSCRCGKTMTKEEMIYDAIPKLAFSQNSKNCCVYYNTHTKKYDYFTATDWDFSISGAMFVSEKDAKKVCDKLNK